MGINTDYFLHDYYIWTNKKKNVVCVLPQTTTRMTILYAVTRYAVHAFINSIKLVAQYVEHEIITHSLNCVYTDQLNMSCQ